MTTIAQIQGMLLEEAILYLLKRSGYNVIDNIDNDNTLLRSSSGIVVKGRGANHQIDAIADFSIAHPFSFAQRLLVEGKFLGRKVGLPIIRNAVGVLKDVSEYFVKELDHALQDRFHYQFAIFSSSEYTKEAEKYAFAHDIYLIPLAKSRFVRPIIDSINKITFESFGAMSKNEIEINLSDLRKYIRKELNDNNSDNLRMSHQLRELIDNFLNACRIVKGALIAMIARRFPIFIVPNPDFDLMKYKNDYQVRIFWDDAGWYIYSLDNKQLFSFDLPEELFRLYTDKGSKNTGILSRERAINLKSDFLREIQAFLRIGKYVKVITLRLDEEWLTTIRQKVRFPRWEN